MRRYTPDTLASFLVTALLAVSVQASAASPVPPAVEETPAAAWHKWKTARDVDLANPATSYLNVLDHAKLSPGGSLYLPVGGPRGQAGWRKEPPGKPMVSVTAKDGRVDVQVSSTGEALDLLASSGAWPTPDGMLVTAEKAGTDWQLILRDPQKDGFKGFKGAPYFDFDPKAVVTAQLLALPKPDRVSMPTTVGAPRQVWLMGTLEFVYEGRKTALKAYCLDAEPSARELFVPFLDATNGIESFAGGRYVETRQDAGGGIVIDFNRAYNPYCARNHVFSCIKVSGKPIESRVLAGEKTPKAR